MTFCYSLGLYYQEALAPEKKKTYMGTVTQIILVSVHALRV